jgi:hypothetical protein
MMSKRVSMRHKRKEAPQWIFPWSGSRQSSLPKVAAFLITVGMFALLLVFVRIQIATPTPWAASKATLFQVVDDADGRALTLRAREGGPFPSRLQPTEIDWLREMETNALAAAGWQPPRHEPRLRELPPLAVPEPRLSAPGAPVLPKRSAPAAQPLTEKSRLVPSIRPLAGLKADELPDPLPDFDGEIPATMPAEPWRFLLHLDASGHVRDVVPLAGGGAGAAAIPNWLRRLDFPPGKNPEGRWVAIGLGFINRPADGTDTD